MNARSLSLRLESLEDRTMLSTCHVTRFGDAGIGMGFRGDLRYCIDKVNANPGGDVIDFHVTGTINLTGPLPDLVSGVDIQGPGSALLTVRRDTGGDYRVLTIAGDTATISGLTIANGRGDVGGGIYNQGTLTLDHVVLNSSTSTSGVGGGIYNAGVLTVTDSDIRGNFASSNNLGLGGGIFNESGSTLTLLNSTVDGNIARSPCQGGSCFNQTAGGGIYNAFNAELTMQYSVIGNNKLDSGATPNFGTMFGIGVYNAGTASIDSSLITSNSMSEGVNPQTGGHGGGVHNAGTMTIVNTTIALNYVRVEGNDATSRGAGIYNASGTLTISHSSVAENILESFAGGISDRKGAGIYVGGGLVHASNTVVADNLSEFSPISSGPSDLWGTLTSSFHNLFGHSADGSGYHASDLLDVDPLLGPLADNGGPTLTMALLPGSAAINAGDNTDAPDFDQRGPGFPRIVNGIIDIGAFEVQSTSVPSVRNLRRMPAVKAVVMTAISALSNETQFDQHSITSSSTL